MGLAAFYIITFILFITPINFLRCVYHFISRETFPDRLSYSTVWERFNILLSDHIKPFGDVEAKARKLLDELLRNREKVDGGNIIDSFTCGKVRFFISKIKHNYIFCT